MTIASFTKPNVSAALHPLHTIWVRASAGSGKTKLLTDRLLRLLLEDIDPQRILCLTFSKAAAYEIEHRLLSRLRGWASQKDEAVLQAELQTLLGRSPEAGDLQKARCLYATLLDATHPITITTIHAFAQKLLQQFALEADIDPAFDVIDASDQLLLWQKACDQVLEAAHYQQLDPFIIEAIHWLSYFVGENRFHYLTSQLRGQKNKLQAVWSAFPDLATYRCHLIAQLGADPDLDAEKVIAQACDLTLLQETNLHKAASILATGKKTDQERSVDIVAWLSAPADQRQQKWENYCQAFLVAKNDEQNWQPRQRLATKALVEDHHDLLAILLDEAQRLVDVKERYHATLVGQASYAVACYGTSLLTYYHALLQQRQAIDFDGLINKAVDLLTSQTITPWVLYKLDGGLDHILVDEAQDTNPVQWQILASLLEHFYIDSPNIDKPRSVFVVGDSKQSIYGFQGADPKHYINFRDWLAERATFHQFKFIDLSLHYSFRSTKTVLETVDQVFNHHHLTSFLLHDGALHHLCWRDGHQGQVVLWPLVEGKGDMPPPWALPTRRWLSPSAPQILAEQIADEIATILADPTPLPSTGKPARPQDIMILIRHRSAFDHAMIRALKARNIAIQNQDKSQLLQHLVIQDLLALAEWSLLPSDDLTLAILLKSPFCNHDEEDLFALAYDRGETSLWQSLGLAAQQVPDLWQTTLTFLHQTMAWAPKLNPYPYFQHVLAYEFADHSTVTDRLIACFGQEGMVVIDGLLDIAQLYDQDQAQGLQNFCQWLRQTYPACPQAYINDQAVRLQTIHSAKGLQAPIVFLPDTVHKPGGKKDFLWADDYVLWVPQKRFWSKLCYEIENAQHHSDLGDYYRLLYVALTRAQDQLYIAGWSSSGQAHPQSWYALLQQTLSQENAL